MDVDNKIINTDIANKYINTDIAYIQLLTLIIDNETLEITYQNKYQGYDNNNKNILDMSGKNIIDVIYDYKSLENIVANTPIKIKLHKKYIDATLTKVFIDKTSSVLFIKTDLSNLTNNTSNVFMSNVSNVLRGPLNGIIGMSRLLQDSDINEEQIGYLDVLKDSSYEIMNIVDNILDYSKLESNKLVLVKKSFYFKNLISSIHDIMFSQFILKGITMIYDISDSVPEFIVCDYTRLQQIFINLYSNSIKFTNKNGKITTTIGYNNNKLEIFIKDTGSGIRDTSKIFIPYSHTRSDTSLDSGLGLGLSIVKKICILMNGDIKLIESSDKGTTFYFDIMIEVSDEERNITDNKYILIVSSIQAIRKNISNIMIKNGLIPCPCSSLDEAIIFIKSKIILDSILIDTELPNYNSVNLAKKIRTLNPIIKLISLGNIEHHSIFDYNLLKPIDEKKLLLIIGI